MFRLEKEFRFEAAHSLPLHDGKCRNPHGHSYRVVLVLESDTLIESGPKSGMVQDYADVQAAFEPLVRARLDHRNLNETLGVPHTTSEHLAAWVYEKLKASLPLLRAVRVHETGETSTEYRP